MSWFLPPMLCLTTLPTAAGLQKVAPREPPKIWAEGLPAECERISQDSPSVNTDLSLPQPPARGCVRLPYLPQPIPHLCGWLLGGGHRLSGHECEQTPGDGGRQGSPMCCRPWGRRELNTT